MPLIKAKSDAAFKANVKTLMGDVGKSPHVQSRQQALAIAYSTKRRAKRARGGMADGGDPDYSIDPGPAPPAQAPAWPEEPSAYQRISGALHNIRTKADPFGLDTLDARTLASGQKPASEAIGDAWDKAQMALAPAGQTVAGLGGLLGSALAPTPAGASDEHKPGVENRILPMNPEAAEKAQAAELESLRQAKSLLTPPTPPESTDFSKFRGRGLYGARLSAESEHKTALEQYKTDKAAYDAKVQHYDDLMADVPKKYAQATDLWNGLPFNERHPYAAAGLSYGVPLAEGFISPYATRWALSKYYGPQMETWLADLDAMRKANQSKTLASAVKGAQPYEKTLSEFSDSPPGSGLGAKAIKTMGIGLPVATEPFAAALPQEIDLWTQGKNTEAYKQAEAKISDHNFWLQRAGFASAPLLAGTVLGSKLPVGETAPPIGATRGALATYQENVAAQQAVKAAKAERDAAAQAAKELKWQQAQEALEKATRKKSPRMSAKQAREGLLRTLGEAPEETESTGGSIGRSIQRPDVSERERGGRASHFPIVEHTQPPHKEKAPQQSEHTRSGSAASTAQRSHQGSSSQSAHAAPSLPRGLRRGYQTGGSPMPSGVSSSRASSPSYSGNPSPRQYAMGGMTAPWWERRQAAEMTHSGPIMSAVPGRTDKINMSVKSGSYVLPAETVSHLGQSNSIAGLKIAGHMFGGRGNGLPKPPAPMMKFATGGSAHDGKPVPIIAAGGEYVIEPDQVARIGGGDVDRGHKILDAFVLHMRKQHLKTIAALKPPAKD